jgi:hypothetical protein
LLAAVGITPLVNQPVVLPVQLNVREYGRREDSNGLGTWIERITPMYMAMRTWSNTSLLVGWDQFQPFANQPVVLGAIERSEEGKQPIVN